MSSPDAPPESGWGQLVIDLDSLLKETPEQPPCGSDLEYDPEFMELEKAARGKPEQQFGETVIPASDPVWGDVRNTADRLLYRSKDLRLAVLLTRALVHTEGFRGLLPGLQLTTRLLEQFWQGVHPTLDASDNDDPTMRMNALAPLVDAEGLPRDLRDAWLVRSRQHGQVMVRDIEVALGKLPPRKGAEPLTQGQIEATLAAAASEDAGVFAEDGQTLVTARALSALLVDKVGAELAPDFKPLLVLLSLVDQVCRGAGGVTGGDAIVDAAAVASEGPAALELEKTMSGEIRNRQDALEMIDRIVAYLEHNEPSNPAPLLLGRAKRLMNMSFVDIIRDLAPDSMAKIEAIAGPASKE